VTPSTLAVALLASVHAHMPHRTDFATIDRCLAAAGNAWNYRTRQCGPAPAGPVDRLYVDKSQHWMAAYQRGVIIREFRVSLGRGGLAPKAREGDHRVPEGLYTIAAHNGASAYHLSLRIGYPTPEQSAAAAASGLRPGGDIFIHGLPNALGSIGSEQQRYDWTDGCIALTDPEMDWVFQAVADGTPIEIRQ
jgi:murein L,D-transpeptidase YafK